MVMSNDKDDEIKTILCLEDELFYSSKLILTLFLWQIYFSALLFLSQCMNFCFNRFALSSTFPLLQKKHCAYTMTHLRLTLFRSFESKIAASEASEKLRRSQYLTPTQHIRCGKVMNMYAKFESLSMNKSVNIKTKLVSILLLFFVELPEKSLHLLNEVAVHHWIFLIEKHQLKCEQKVQNQKQNDFLSLGLVSCASSTLIWPCQYQCQQPEVENINKAFCSWCKWFVLRCLLS